MLEALEDNVAKSKGGKQKMVEQCIMKLREKRCMTQYIVLLKSLLDSLEAKGSLFGSSEYEKALERLYAGNLASVAFEEYVETSKRPASEEEAAFNEEKVFTSRLQLLILLIFKGKPKADGSATFRRLLAFLHADASQNKNLERFIAMMIQKDIANIDNIEIFFHTMNDLDALDNQYISANLFRLYEDLFLKCNVRNGALEYPTNSKKNLVHIAKQEKFLFLKQLWNFCLKRSLKGANRENFYKLLVECYFRTTRKYEASEAQKAWTYFTNDVAEELNSVKAVADDNARAILLGNLAGIWIKTIEISSGSLYLPNNSPSPDTINVHVVDPRLPKKHPTAGGVISTMYTLPSNSSLNFLKNSVIEDRDLQEYPVLTQYRVQPHVQRPATHA